MRYVIGVHDGHNASACLLAGGRILYAVQEERLTGRKNQAGTPWRAIEACLHFADLAPARAARLAFGSLRTTPAAFRAADQRQKFLSERTLRGPLVRALAWRPYYRLNADLGWRQRLRDAGRLGFGPDQLVRYDHHRCHAASAYFGLRRSAHQPCLVVTADGYGDLSSCALYVGANDQLTRIAHTPFTDSLGTLYFLVTGAMGFVPLEHEYKLMGMAAYASPEPCRPLVEAFHELLEFDEERLRFRRRTMLPTIALARRILELIKGHRFDDVCAALQRFTEEMLERLVRAAIRRTGLNHVLCAGGVFMNVKANQRLAALPEVEHLAVFPSPGDETLALGACYLAHADGEPDRGRGIAPLGDFYLGDDISEDACREVLGGAGHELRRYDDVEREVADLLAAGRIVARCKGRMEFGARALGNRSILADPSNQDAVRVINRMIKQRDFWMPFAPVVRHARSQEYFDNPKDLPSPYMMLTFNTKANFGELIAAVHNADLTARPQLLEPDHNPDLDRLLRYFEHTTGRGALLNTSFNLHGSPIVRGPQEALAVFAASGLEILNLGQYIVAKRAAGLRLRDVARRLPAPAAVAVRRAG
jgi:carbamoyltransferase